MFFLKKHSCGLPARTQDHVESDEFGWWLTGFKPEPQTHEEVLPSIEGNSVDLHEKNDHGGQFASQTVEKDSDDICTAEEPPCEPSSRSYTPERLVRNQDYSILAPSPTLSSASLTEPSTPVNSTPSKRCSNKRYRRLSHLIDQNVVGASQLEALLDPEAFDIRIPVAVGRGKLFKDSFPKESKPSGDILVLANSGSPRRLLTPDLMSSGSSCERLNSESCQENGEAVGELQGQGFGGYNNGFENGLSSIVGNSLWDDHREEDLCDLGFVPETQEDPEIAVQNLRERIEHIGEMNKDMFEDLSSLRKNFQWAEMKTGNLTTEMTRLRREIRELRYLDDLVNLLKGELERISERNWPFSIGHTDQHAEEVNLVV